MFSPSPSPISRTVTYRKVTKPLLERKRRARINRCLDELKDLMYTALEAEGENVDKLEKADILEFTVKHLQKITRRDPVEEAYKFQEGFSQCASEACSFLLSLPGLDTVVGRRLVEYLAKSVSRALETQLPSAAAATASVSAGNIKSPAAVGGTAATTAARDNSTPVTAVADAVARGHTPPSSDPPTTPPAVAQLLPSPPCRRPTTDASPQPPKPVALTASNRGPHTVVRPKPTRPAAFAGRSSSSTLPHIDVVAAAAAAAAQRDPMWRPW